MSIQEHPDYQKEVKRLKDTITYMKQAILAAEKGKESHKEEIKQAYQDLDPMDSSQSYVSIMLHTKLLDELMIKYESLIKVKEKPYFARIDFVQKGETEIEKFYIGKISLFRPEEEHPLILDWRSPLASIYYDGRLGQVSYDSYGGKMYGELLLKRQYTIEQECLKSIMDIDITATDTFLQASLGENKDNRLKDIVSTIQAEQNAIIRADINRTLIVQGVAGSGKTTIALHRIAYLIYTYEKSFDPENFMIIAPNRLFLNYISEVLPELGADKVLQITYTDLVFDLIGQKFTLLEPDDKLVSLLAEPVKKEIRLAARAAEWKGSSKCMLALEDYIMDLEKTFVPDQDFSLEGYPILSAKQVAKIFLEDYRYLPFEQRFEQVKKHLRYRLRTDKTKIITQAEQVFDVQISAIRNIEPESEERRRKIVALLKQRDEQTARMKKVASSLVKQYMKLFTKRTVFEYYLDFIGNKSTLQKYYIGEKDSEFLSFLVHTTRHHVANKQLELEDLAPLLYIRHRVIGFAKPLEIKYVVIDEAQDFSYFQFYVLKEIFHTDLFTILGDLSQGIHSYRSISDWEEVLEDVFKRKTQYLELEQSYRTTIEIMNVANQVIMQLSNDKLILAKPVVRHGEEPDFIEFRDEILQIQAIENQVKQWMLEGYQSIAVIGKTPKECTRIQKLLEKRKHIQTKLLEGKEEEYETTIVVLPSHLAKGLEFDAVIIATIKDCYGILDLELKLLYVAMTRALHRLVIFYQKDTLPKFLSKK